MSFYKELTTKYKASVGTLPWLHVIAHEVGHHVQMSWELAIPSYAARTFEKERNAIIASSCKPTI